jgi:hypothetical protein
MEDTNRRIQKYLTVRDAQRMAKGFSYTLEKEKIQEYMKLSTKDKLKWLEEINDFTNMVLTDREKRIRAKFRDGMI